MDTLWPLLLLVFVANGIEAIAGFGSTILSLTIGAQFFSIADLLAMLVPLNLLLSIGILATSYREIAWRIFFTRILPIAGAGLPLGIYLFRVLDGRATRIAFGVVVVLLGVEGLVRLKRRGLQLDSELATAKQAGFRSIFLFLGGIMQGMYASGGPLIVYYASRMLPDKRRFRATLSLLWFVMNLVLLTNLVLVRQVNAYTLQFTFYLIPAVLLGLFLGMKAHHRVSERNFQIGVYSLLVIAGLALLKPVFL